MKGYWDYVKLIQEGWCFAYMKLNHHCKFSHINACHLAISFVKPQVTAKLHPEWVSTEGGFPSSLRLGTDQRKNSSPLNQQQVDRRVVENNFENWGRMFELLPRK